MRRINPHTVGNRILTHLKSATDLTATQLARAINAKPSTVSVAVLRLLRHGKLKLAPKPGPRGGKAYRLNPSTDPNAWDRLRENELL